MVDEKEDKKTSHGGRLPRHSFYLVLILLIGLGGLVWYQFQVPDSPSQQGKPTIGGPFTLVDHNGKTVSEADFMGRHMLVFFGYTYCPDVCPTSLSTIADALDMIGDKASLVTPIFITIDPERDTPEYMSEYVKYFHPKLVGLSGSLDQVAEAAKAYKVYFAKADAEAGEDYLMDHSSVTYLMGPDGQYVSHFSRSVSAEDMAKRLMDIL